MTAELKLPDRPRFWSEADCRAVAERVRAATTGGGETTVLCWSLWTGYVRWARNLISTAGETRTNYVHVDRVINGAAGSAITFENDVTDDGISMAVRHAERLALRAQELGNVAEIERRFPQETPSAPHLFSDATYQLDAPARADAAHRLTRAASQQGLLSAGYIQVTARSIAWLDSFGSVRYFPFTHAQYSVTVRDPKGSASGWGGDSSWDWAALDPERITQVALDKCVKSRDAVRVEPGRYTVILEPQAVADFVGQLFTGGVGSQLDRQRNESPDGTNLGPFQRSPLMTRLGDKVIDERLSLSSDPNDPDVGYPPFAFEWGDNYQYNPNVRYPATWIKNGVLERLAYWRPYGVEQLGENTGLPNAGAFRMRVSGPTATIDEMVARTQRGLLVTRFDQMQLLQERSMLVRAYTRDGLWLIENGKITKPAKNMQITQPVVAALNNVEAAGTPTRVYRPVGRGVFSFLSQPAVVPALMLRDFNFTALSDAV